MGSLEFDLHLVPDIDLLGFRGGTFGTQPFDTGNFQIDEDGGALIDLVDDLRRELPAALRRFPEEDVLGADAAPDGLS